MPELRKDPIIGRWVIISTERAKRPNDFRHEEICDKEENCPFCEGNECQTPSEILAIRDENSKPNEPGWEARIIPSQSGFLNPKGDLDRHGKGIYDLMNGVGNHEILVVCPEHTGDIHSIDDARIARMIELLMRRIMQLRDDKRLKYVLVFANHGRAAGGSNLRHLHLQLIATPVTPKRVKEELAGTRRYFDYKDRCVFCDMIKQEAREDKRVICKIDGFIAITPFCSRFPFETWIMPTEHSCDIDQMSMSHMKNLGKMYKYVFTRMNKLLGNFPFNAILHTAPFRRRQKKGYWETLEHDFHWHLEIMPRLTQVAGFEWGSGFYINPMPPEDACKALKEVKL
jgi:UDPglucose--hexose-1-phosphate uridylyltransferase